MSISIKHVVARIRNLKPTVRLTASAAILLALQACGSIPNFSGKEYVDPLGSTPAVENLTQYSKALDCLGDYFTRRQVPLQRFAVGRVEDYTGKQDLVNGKRVTQGASLMVMSALSRGKVPLVERLDFSVGEMELKYTDLKLIGEDTNKTMRQTFGGSVVGSDYFVVGGITEVNYNIRSGSFDGTVKYLGSTARYAVLDVGLDLRLVNTRTLQVVKVSSLRKQIIGTEIRLGFFRFLNDTTVDLNVAERAQEPIQKSIRMLAEHAVYDMLAEIYNVPAGTCNVNGSFNNSSSSSSSSSNNNNNNTQTLAPTSPKVNVRGTSGLMDKNAGALKMTKSIGDTKGSDKEVGF
jgi:curli biogenesis system outer membrane secretion channel CsgG